MDSTPKLNRAIAHAQSEMSNPKFDGQNPHFKSKFASLKAVRESVIPVFTRNGIAVVQDLQTIDGCAAVFTHLLHDSGEHQTYGPFIVPKTKNDAQGLASASTYARRYHLQSVAGVVGEEDDDGNAASDQTGLFREIANLLDGALVVRDQDGHVESTEGVDTFAEKWRSLDQDTQKAFGGELSTYFPNRVSKMKAHMHDVMGAWRESQNGRDK